MNNSKMIVLTVYLVFLIHPNPFIYVLTLFYFEEILDTKILFDIWLHKLALSMNQKTFAKCKTFMSSFRQIQDFCRSLVQGTVKS